MKRGRRGRRLALFFSFAALTLLAGCAGGQPAGSWFGVAADGDVVYLAANQQVFALSLEDAAVLWKFPPEPDKETGPFYATPLLLSDAIVVGGFNDGKLYAVSRNPGEQKWVVDLGAPIVEGAVATDGGIVVGNGEGEVYLVDAATQEKRLLLKTDEPIWSTPLVDEVGGRAYIASMDHHLYAVDLDSAELVWSFEAGGALAGTPALRDGVVYFGDFDSRFYALDAETSEELWHFDTKGWVWGGPLVHEGSVFFGDMAGRVYALNVADGSPRWTFEAGGAVRVTPVMSDNVLFLGARGGKVYALSEDGTQLWTQDLGGSIYSQPLAVGDYLLISPHNTKVQLVALDAKSGAERWSYPPREE